MLADRVAVYAAPMDRCLVAGETVRPQPGGFYGGWVTGALAGPFKGIPGSMGWWGPGASVLRERLGNRGVELREPGAGVPVRRCTPVAAR